MLTPFVAVAKLADFGISQFNDPGNVNGDTESRKIGTPRYNAPEILRGEWLAIGQFKMADVYSMALLAFELAAHMEPFKPLNMKQMEKLVG